MRHASLVVAVVLAAALSGCTQEVNLPPQLVLKGPDVVRVKAPAVFDASGSSDPDGFIDTTAFKFDFGDGTEAVTGVTSAAHTFAAKGDFTVTVEVTDDAGAVAKTSKLVTVTDNVTPVAGITGPNLVRRGAEAKFDASASSDADGQVTGYSFDFGDGSAKVAGVSVSTHVFAGCAGDKFPCAYTVSVEVVDNDGAKATAAIEVTVTDNVVPSASITGPSSARINQIVSFDASASTDPDGAIAAFSFDFGDSTPAVTGVRTAQHAYSAKGYYSVTLEVTDNDGAKATATIQVTVTDNLAPVAALLGPAEARVNTAVSFDASDSADPDGTVAAFKFDFGDSSADAVVQGVKVAQHAYTAAGAYVVSLEVTDNDGAIGAAAVQILVSDNIPPVAAFTGPATAVVGDVVTFDASPSSDLDGAIAKYSFDFDGDATVDAEGGTVQYNHVYTAAGVFNTTLRVTDNDGADNTAARQISVKTGADSAVPPIASFVSPAQALVNQAVAVDGGASSPGSGAITAYEWDFGDTATGSGATAVHTYTAAGVYDISLKVTATYKDATTLSNTMTRQIDIEDNTVSITSITPASGSTSGGTTVAIKGKGFTSYGVTTLMFGPNNALAVDVIDSTNMTAVTPPGVPGPVDVWLTNQNGSIIHADGFTYLGTDNRATTTYCPVALVAGGTSVGFAANDDDVNLAVDLPFDFEFFGKVYPVGTKLRVTTNGWISFTDAGASFTHSAIPSAANPATLIAPFFMDMTAGAGGQVYVLTTGTAPNRQFAVAWRSFSSRAAGGDVYNFEAVLYESSNDIKFQYLNTYGGQFAGGTSALAGIQGSSVAGVQAFRNSATRGLAPGGRVYAFSYAGGAYAMATDATLTVFSSNPANNGTLPTNGSFTVGFSIPLNPSTISGTNVQLFDVTTSASVNANYAVSGDKLTVTGTPASPLTIDDRYRVTVTTNVFGANKAQFSQDPTKAACAAVSNPAAFTFEFTAVAGAVQKVNLGGGSTPQGIAVSSAANLAYIAKGNGNRAVSVDTNSLSVTNNIALSDCTNPMGIAVTPNGQRTFITCMNGTGRVAAIDTNGTFVQIDVNGVNPGVQSIAVGSNPDGIAIRSAGDRVYAANSGSNTVSVIETSTFNVLTAIGVGNTARGAAVNPAGTRLYVANEGDDSLSVIDVQSGSGGENSVLQTVDVSGSCSGPRGVAVRPDGNRVYVTCRFDDAVLVLDAANFNEVATIPTGDQPLGIAVSTSGKLAMVAETGGTDSVGVLNLDSNTYLTQVPLGGGTNPFWVVFRPNSSVGLVTLSGSNELAEVF
ncbi:MAG: PKD domain-containing protein [Deltaproteobacteria bacterium]|nr:PKD domain-containing protein [Deltaproteobacteria bacterium]